MRIFDIVIDDNIGASVIMIAWMLSFSLLLYLIFVKMPRFRREMEESMPNLVWNALKSKMTDMKNPETQAMVGGLVIFALKAIMSDKKTRLVINGKLEELSHTGVKYLLSAIKDETGVDVKQLAQFAPKASGGGGGGGGLGKIKALAEAFGIDIDGILG